jgi:hypothetical protein
MGLFRGRYIGDALKQFQDEYGDAFQIYLRLLHLICVCNPGDVQYVFTHRHIYEQGDLHINQHRLVFNDALICNMDTFIHKASFRREYKTKISNMKFMQIFFVFPI